MKNKKSEFKRLVSEKGGIEPFCKYMNCTKKTYHNWVNGMMPTFNNMRKMAKYFGTTFIYVYNMFLSGGVDASYKEMKIYFAGSIRGGREDKELYAKMIDMLNGYGKVLTEHIGLDNLPITGEGCPSDKFIHDRDLAWLKESDVIIAEVTTPSLGVGYEIAKAEEWGKSALCLYRDNGKFIVSAMIAGSDKVMMKKYKTIEDLKPIFDVFFKSIK